MKLPKLPKLPCPDTPENRKLFVDEMLAAATRERDARRQGMKAVEKYPYLLIAHNGQLHHARPCDCKPEVFVIAEHVRDEVTLIEKLHREVRWVLPPVQLRRKQ